ncbi:MAG: isocitrate/isopropylmalate family dehydrogenase [Promethearchaeota archaeon]
MEQVIEKAKEHFEALVKAQLNRIEEMKKGADWIDYSSLKPINIGVAGGDGIGPEITKHAEAILKFLLKEEVQNGKVVFKHIEGLTIENRAKTMKAIPDEVLEQLKNCTVILKGPTYTPSSQDLASGKWPNLESANVTMRRELDLFANVRPVKVPEKGINWMFFRENTEGAYVLGSKGIKVTDDLAFDFCVHTLQGTDRILRLAFEHAKKTGMNRVSLVTKANVVKTTDGMYLNMAKQLAKEEYPEVKFDDWYIDIMAAKLIDPERQKDFKVIVAPNLYGDIITDEAAQIQGSVGTAGSANIGKRYSMFEAIHGTAPRMVETGRTKYADPTSIIKAAAMLLNHIGFVQKARKLEMALDICAIYEKKLKVTGRDTGATGEQFAEYIMDTLQDPELERKWERYQKK